MRYGVHLLAVLPSPAGLREINPFLVPGPELATS